MSHSSSSHVGAPTKITVVGAGSAVFGSNTLSALLRSELLHGSHLALADINPSALVICTRLAERLNREWNSGFTITSHKDHKDGEALAGSKFVICSVEVGPREALWESDYKIPLKYGIRQPYAENGGPAGFAHAARNIGAIMDIVHTMEDLCPSALFINYTNPMIRICDAVNRYSKIQCVGLCHQILAGYNMVAVALASELNIKVPVELEGMHASLDQAASQQALKEQIVPLINIRAAGLNHFTWMLSVHEHSGRDLYPLLRQRFFELKPSFEPLTRHVFENFPLFPTSGDTHLCEFLPWFKNSQVDYNIRLYDWEAMAADRCRYLEFLNSMANHNAPVDCLRITDSEGAVEIIENTVRATPYYHLAANLRNIGQISNLPLGATVETPVIVDGGGVHAVTVGALPPSIADLCSREITRTQLCVDSVMEGCKEKALQCLLLDPFIPDIDSAKKILDDYLESYKEYLPSFNQNTSQ